MLRKLASVVAAASMLVSTAAMAAGDTEQAALPPGNAAGIQQAEGMDIDVTMGILATVVLITSFVLVATGTGGTSVTNTTSTPR